MPTRTRNGTYALGQVRKNVQTSGDFVSALSTAGPARVVVAGTRRSELGEPVADWTRARSDRGLIGRGEHDEPHGAACRPRDVRYAGVSST